MTPTRRDWTVTLVGDLLAIGTITYGHIHDSRLAIAVGLLASVLVLAYNSTVVRKLASKR